MKPQHIFNKLAKFNKSEPVKVEMSLIGDLQKALDFGSSLRKKMDSQMNDAIKALSAYENVFEQIQKDKSNADDYIGLLRNFKMRLESESKALGIDPKDIKEYNEIQKSMDMTEGIRNAMNNLPIVD